MSGHRLPSAEFQNPSCGACFRETHNDGDFYVCEACGLAFDNDDLEAFFLDESDEPCGEPCGNWWHGDGRLNPSSRMKCYPCALPKGHASDHWTGCEHIA